MYRIYLNGSLTKNPKTMQETQTPPDLSELALQLIAETEQELRDAFTALRRAEFSSSKKDTLEHNNICHIEQTFRDKQTECFNLLKAAYVVWREHAEKMEALAKCLAHMSLNVAKTLVIRQQGIKFTFGAPTMSIVPSFKTGNIAERSRLINRAMRECKKSTTMLFVAYEKVKTRRANEAKVALKNFQEKVREILIETLPQHIKEIKELIREKSLHRIAV